MLIEISLLTNYFIFFWIEKTRMPFPWFEEDENPNALGVRTIFSNCPIGKFYQTFPEGFSFKDDKLTGSSEPATIGVVFDVTPESIVGKIFQSLLDKWHLVSTHTLSITSSSGIYQIFDEDASKSSREPLHPSHQHFFAFLANYLLMAEAHTHNHPKHAFTDEITGIVSYISVQITDESGLVLTKEDKKVDIATSTHSLGLKRTTNPLKIVDMRNATKSFLVQLLKLFTGEKFNLVFQDDCAFVAGVLSDSSVVDDCYSTSESATLDLKGKRVLFLSLTPLTSTQKADIKSLPPSTVFLSVHSS